MFFACGESGRRPCADRAIGRLLGVTFLFVLGLAAQRPAWAAPKGDSPVVLPAGAAGIAIPEPLRPFVGWVLHDKAEALCPFLHGEGEAEGRHCLWPAELDLSLSDKGGRFSQRWRVYKKAWVPLPGDSKVWPQSVLVDGKPAVVAAPHGEDSSADSESPQVELQPGSHVVSGVFLWDELPESLAVPPSTGLLALSVRGTRLTMPSRDEDGRVWLQKAATEKEEEVLELTVHRKVQDEVPLQLSTRIELRVSGKSREVVLGRALPAGFIPLSLEGPLPARLEPDSRLRVQVRAGTFVLSLIARHEGPVKQLARPKADGLWPEDEVWVWDARPSLRAVRVEGVPLIDPQQTTLLDAWKKLPCYAMRTTDTMNLIEERRGDADPAADELALSRELWLDFDGRGYTVRDHITGTLHRAWRLEVNPPMELGRVAVDGQDQFITKLSGGSGQPGVEVRQAELDLSADSRIVPNHRGELPVIGWDADFREVERMTLHLPPGWRLFHASGADEVSETWIGKWTLLDLFLLLITAMAVTRLYGPFFGAMALLMLGLSLSECDAPRWLWVSVLAAEALLRVLPLGKIRSVTQVGRIGCLIALGIFATSFAADAIRGGLYPVLEHPDHRIGEEVATDAVPGWLKKKRKRMIAPDEAMAGILGPNLDKDNGDAAGGLKNDPADSAGGLVGSGRGGGGAGDADATVDRRKDGAKFLALKSKAAALEMRDAQEVSKKVGTLGILNSNSYAQQYAQNMQQLDPNSVVQTGPGVPRWSYNRAVLSFMGPVQRHQQLRLWLVPPTANLVLSLLRVALLALLFWRLAGLQRFGWPPRPQALGRPSGMALMLAVLLPLGFGSGVARAELPGAELLNTLQERLLEPPECHPNCASSSRLYLEVQPRLLRARMEVGAAATTAVPLPGGAKQWLPERVILDGKPAAAMLRTDDGKLWLQLSEGSHQVILEGALPNRETVQIALPLKPHRVEARTQGWRLDGLHEDGEADDDLQLSRIESNQADAPSGLSQGTLPPFVRVEREIFIGLKWEVQTRIVRMTPTGSAVVLEVPLLPGESVTTPEVRVQGQKALCNMAPGATELSWHSLLQERPELTLSAPQGLPLTEVWRLDVSPIWHATVGGIPVVQQSGEPGNRRPSWQPWPGEQVRIALRRPDGVAGSTLTIDHSLLEISPGLRATEATLTVELRSSRGGQHTLTLPEGATLESLLIGGEKQPPRQEGRNVTLPLSPGQRQIKLRWRQPNGIAFLFRTPAVTLGAASVNAQVVLRVPHGRWLLFCGTSGSQALGPVVLFWSYVPLLVLLSFLLARLRLTPLRATQYFVLGLGLSQVPLLAAALFIGWLLCLGWRERQPSLKRYWLFDLRQLLIVIWTVVALAVLVAAIHEGLLGHPDMQIRGNGSSRGELRFFLDHAPLELPICWLVSLPLLSYRLAMLLWALWMAASLLRWLRWGVGAFGLEGYWQPRPKKGDAAGAVPQNANPS